MINKNLILSIFVFSMVMGQGKVPNVRLKMLDGSSAKLYDYLPPTYPKSLQKHKVDWIK